MSQKNNLEGTTELRQMVFADANAGATSVTAKTKKNMIGSGASDVLNHSISMAAGGNKAGGMSENARRLQASSR
tara:strand:- start:39 stop:260 length:222 start_codon:yes stop_codon:yes gene_type:complete